MKPSLVFAAVLFSLSAPALAEVPTEHRFEHQGISYVYSVSTEGDTRTLTGRQYPNGARFRLTIRDGRVTGRMNGSAVRFRLSSVDDLQSQDMTLASR
jgi:ketosteroid isomerase-like protein